MPNDQSQNIAVAAQILGDSVNAWSAANTNKKQRQWQEAMYGRQRADALADWNQQNEYNSPAAQMARLKAAGLNPNLVYGTGASAMSSQQPRQSSPGSWSPSAPQIHPEQAVVSYYNTKMQEAAIRNMDTKNTVLLADAAKKAGELDKLRVSTMKEQSSIKSIDQMTAQRTSLLPILMEQIKANIERSGAATGVLHSDKMLKDVQKLNVEMQTAKGYAEKQVILERNEREAAMNSQSIAESVQRILNLRQEEAKSETEQIHIRQMIKLAEADTKIKEADARLKQKGIQPGDWFLWRTTQDILNHLQQKAKPGKPGDPIKGMEGGGQERSF